MKDAWNPFSLGREVRETNVFLEKKPNYETIEQISTTSGRMYAYYAGSIEVEKPIPKIY